jgi:dolichol-phosphate mannosyltransferase
MRAPSAAASPPHAASPPQLLSVVVPARNEEGSLRESADALLAELARAAIPHELVIVDDGSTDRTAEVVRELAAATPGVRLVRNLGRNGFGRAVIRGLEEARGDALVLYMADGSDATGDVVTYWRTLCAGWDCIFGSRFVRGGAAIDYPWPKLVLNRLANWFLRLLFRIPLNDTTNAFKAYRRHVIDGCRPLLSPHFNLTVELPLKAIVRGYSWTVVPVTWRGRREGATKLRIKEMGSRYLYICLAVWLEKLLTRDDYRRTT